MNSLNHHIPLERGPEHLGTALTPTVLVSFVIAAAIFAAALL